MGKQQHGRSKYETNKNNNDEDNSSEDSQLEPKTSLAVPAMSIAGIAALNSGLNTFMSTKGTSSIASAGVLTAAAVAAGEGLKYYNDRLLTKKAFDQTKTIYNREKIQAKELHNDALQNERRLHYQELEREAEQHLQDMTNQLRESQKEADRDLWEQQNTEKQNSMTVAALFLAGAFALAVEGQLPPNTGGLYFFPSISLLNAYYFCLAACIALLFISILSGMVVVKRMARFMLSRTAKQQETLKQLRELANKQLRELQGSESRYFSDSTSSLKGLSEMNNNNNNEGGGGGGRNTTNNKSKTTTMIEKSSNCGGSTVCKEFIPDRIIMFRTAEKSKSDRNLSTIERSDYTSESESNDDYYPKEDDYDDDDNPNNNNHNNENGNYNSDEQQQQQQQQQLKDNTNKDTTTINNSNDDYDDDDDDTAIDSTQCVRGPKLMTIDNQSEGTDHARTSLSELEAPVLSTNFP
mmetsp:Transcript_9412/g.13759  ORF Transcript_9412/g.13759 Transcript_9412/m.13759 type:complete len:466 (-) Transcript_9412:113-1510(-)